jgi:hypothetical protein
MFPFGRCLSPTAETIVFSGQDGYIYIERGLNLCAIANVVTIPVAAA